MAKADIRSMRRMLVLGALSLALTCAGLAGSREAAKAAVVSDAYLLTRM
ncbi:MAG TPA: hypothetical protein VHM92_05785 [Allosphingosinicella sp.]|nr:hypothetical protein [Allosphingosinicella sp.]